MYENCPYEIVLEHNSYVTDFKQILEYPSCLENIEHVFLYFQSKRVSYVDKLFENFNEIKVSSTKLIIIEQIVNDSSYFLKNDVLLIIKNHPNYKTSAELILSKI